MLGSLNEWYVRSCHQGCITDYYFTAGDTIINGRNFKFLDGYHYNKNFLISEDSVKQQVFMRILAPGFERFEYLIYDFSLEIGETITVTNPIAPVEMNPGVYTVDSVHFNLFENIERKVLYLSGPNPNLGVYNQAVWVEGIGGLSIINAPGISSDEDGVGALTCSFKDGQKNFQKQNDTTNCQSEYTGIRIPEIASKKCNISMFNNASILNVIGIKETGKIEVFNLQGSKVFESTCSNYSNQIALPQIKSALYLVRFQNQKCSFSKSLFII